MDWIGRTETKVRDVDGPPREETTDCGEIDEPTARKASACSIMQEVK